MHHPLRKLLEISKKRVHFKRSLWVLFHQSRQVIRKWKCTADRHQCWAVLIFFRRAVNFLNYLVVIIDAFDYTKTRFACSFNLIAVFARYWFKWISSLSDKNRFFLFFFWQVLLKLSVLLNNRVKLIPRFFQKILIVLVLLTPTK